MSAVRQGLKPNLNFGGKRPRDIHKRPKPKKPGDGATLGKVRKPTRRRRRRRTGPQLSPNPGRTARFYRTNKRSRLKHRRDQRLINSTPQKKRYRRDLMKIRRRRKPGPQTDMSHKRGRIVAESRKANRGRGGKQKS